MNRLFITAAALAFCTVAVFAEESAEELAKSLANPLGGFT